MGRFLVACFWATLAFSVPTADAVINPNILKQFQKRAPEKVVVKITQVTIETDDRSRFVTAKGKVQYVHESRSGLKKGQRITIKYTSRKRRSRASGPKPIPLLSKGVTGAYLSGSKGLYSPVARSHSFVSPKKIRTLKSDKQR